MSDRKTIVNLEGDEEVASVKKDNPYYHGPSSDHFNGEVFYNPNGTAPMNFSDVLRWRFREKSSKWPKFWPSPFKRAVPEQRIDGGKIVVTMIGHASFLIQTAGLNILTDPVYADRVSPFSFIGPKRVNKPGIAFDDLPPIDFILLSHNHYDHCDLDTLKRLNDNHRTILVTPLGNDRVVLRKIPNMEIRTGDWSDCLDFHGQVKVHFEPCHHWSARGLKDRRMALWAAFVIETPYGKIYHIGDTGFHDGINYRAAGEKYGEFDLAILPIGAYEPRWMMQGQHQNPDEAVRGMMLCNARQCVGHHWGTFQLTNEAIDAPKTALAQALNDHNIAENRFLAMQPGQVVSLDN